MSLTCVSAINLAEVSNVHGMSRELYVTQNLNLLYLEIWIIAEYKS